MRRALTSLVILLGLFVTLSCASRGSNDPSRNNSNAAQTQKPAGSGNANRVRPPASTTPVRISAFINKKEITLEYGEAFRRTDLSKGRIEIKLTSKGNLFVANKGLYAGDYSVLARNIDGSWALAFFPGELSGPYLAKMTLEQHQAPEPIDQLKVTLANVDNRGVLRIYFDDQMLIGSFGVE